MNIALGYLLKALLLPPCGNLMLALCGWLVRRRRPRVGTWLIRVALGSLVILMLPLVGTLLATPLESEAAFEPSHGTKGAQAIVILGGGRRPAAPEYAGQDTVHPRTLERLRYGVFLHRYLDLPLALVGGTISEGFESEGMLMLDVINDTFKVPVQWVETDSRNTAENAQYARRLVPADRILLVTHALHMRRARMMFEANGFEVIPAPLGFRSIFDIAEVSFRDFVPSVDALDLSHDALHEYLGLVWYRLYYRAD